MVTGKVNSEGAGGAGAAAKDHKVGRHTSAIQNELLLASLTKFFSRSSHLKLLLGIINKTSNISLRLIDWFVTNYSKKHNIVIVKTVRGADEHINVYQNYRSQLRAFSKHLFDPFRRQDKIAFNEIYTTIGQLNFFRWAIENDIIVYIQANYARILQDMNGSQECTEKAPQKKGAQPTRKCSNDLSSPKNKPSAGGGSAHSNAAGSINLASGRRMIRFD